MILAYEYFLMGGIFLCEVETEEEAFFEMRRFLEVNRILSDRTTVRTAKDKSGESNEIIYKNVEMTFGCGNKVTFGIHYTGRPSRMELGDEASWNLDRSNLASYETLRRYDAAGDRIVCWYDEVAAYLADLKTRKAGSMQCR